ASIRLANRAKAGLLNSNVIEIMFQETSKLCQDLFRARNQNLEVKLGIILAEGFAIRASFPHDPFPVQTRCNQTAVSGKRTNPALLMQGCGCIAPITNNMNYERGRKQALN